jgi:hypothetical protein
MSNLALKQKGVTMKHSESLDKIAPALCKAQSEMAGAKLNSNNPFFKSKYSNLTSVWLACKEALHANGLSVIQSPVSSEGRIGVSTMLLHSSGQFLTEEFTLGVKKENDPQADGSSITYARRYSLAAFVGIAPEDDDCETAMHRGGKTPDKTPIAKTPSKAMSEKQVKMVYGKLKAKKLTPDDLLKHFKRDSINDFTMQDVPDVLMWIEGKFNGYESKKLTFNGKADGITDVDLGDIFKEDK